MSTSKRKPWKRRIVGHDSVSPDSLLANPFNHRRHPQKQRDALAAAIRDVGFIRSVTVNRRTGHLIDGHERVWQAMTNEEPLIDVEYVDLSEAEEKTALATLDRIGELAEVDAAALDALLRDIETGEAELQALLAEMAADAGVVPVDESEWPEIGPPESHSFTVRYVDADLPAMRTFLGVDELPENRIGAMILERLKAVVAD